jgi:prolyl oligopeptidase
MRSLIALVVLVAACGGPPAPARPSPAATPAAPASAPAPVPRPASPEADMVPRTRTVPVVDVLHGVKVADPFRWLEDEKAPEVQAWMKEQNRVARAALGRLPGRAALARRFKDLYYLDSLGAPSKRGGRLFYVRTHKEKEKAVVYWREGPRGRERVLLDPNTWSADGTVSLGTWSPSWDGKKVAFAKRPNAADEATLYLLEVETGAVSKVDVIPGAKYAHPDWTPDSKGFYYTWLPVDPSIPVDKRPGYAEIRYHAVGTDPAKDPVIHERTNDPTTFLSPDLSRDGRWLFVYVQHGWNENDIWVRDLRDRKQKGFRLVVKGKDALYGVHAWQGQLYIHTNEGASNHRVFKTPATRFERRHWKEIVPEDKAANLEGVRLVGGHLVLEYLRNAFTELRVVTLAGKPARTITLPGIGTASNVHGLEDDDDGYFAYSSFTQPPQVRQVSIKTARSTLWSKVEVPVDPRPYVVEQVTYPSKDGTRVSMFIVRRRDSKLDGQNPTLLYGYGGFLVNMTPSFASSIYPWLEAGGVYAVPNLRGGGEYGKKWHDAGKGANKQNVFDDYVAAAEWLIANKYTSPAKLAIYGGSNGGLLVGAAMVQRPDLYRAVVCAVPLLDMVRYHRFGSGRTWISEYGTAEKEAEFRVLHAYSPYHHVKPATRYPALLMLSSDHDDRVDPMHARKFTAAIQAAQAGKAPALLRIEMNAGHGGADQVRRRIEQSADTYAFLMKQLGVTPPARQPAAP